MWLRTNGENSNGYNNRQILDCRKSIMWRHDQCNGYKEGEEFLLEDDGCGVITTSDLFLLDAYQDFMGIEFLGNMSGGGLLCGTTISLHQKIRTKVFPQR